MNGEVKDFISKCDVCNSMGKEQSKEPMISHEVPDRAWKTVSTDIFQLRGQDYIVLVDHYSDSAVQLDGVQEVCSRLGV
jgi:hypothetical protein